MKKKQVMATCLTAVMTGAMLLSGCGNSQGSTGAGTADTAAQKAADAPADASSDDSAGTSSGEARKDVVIWDYFETDAQKAMMQTLIDGFNGSQSEYTASHVYVPFADYEKQLTLGVASGELPDIVIMDGCGMASFISMDLFGDISDADIKWDEYIAGPMESTMMDGKHYGIPFATNCTALF